MKKDKAALWLSRGNLMVPNSLWGVWNREELITLLPSPWWVMLSYLLGAVNWMTWFQVSTKEVIVVWWSLLWRFGLGHFVWSKGIAFVKKQFLWWRTHCFGALQLPKTSENYLLSEWTLCAVFHSFSTVTDINVCPSARMWNVDTVQPRGLF